MTDKEIAEVFDRFMGTPDGWAAENLTYARDRILEQNHWPIDVWFVLGAWKALITVRRSDIPDVFIDVNRDRAMCAAVADRCLVEMKKQRRLDDDAR